MRLILTAAIGAALAGVCCVAAPVGAQADFDADTTIDFTVLGDARIAANAADAILVRLVGGGVVEGSLNVYQNGGLEIAGGRVNGFLQALGDSQVTLTQGAVRDDAYLLENARMTMTGGTVGKSVYANGSSVFSLNGGAVDGTVYAFESGSATLTSGAAQAALIGDTASFSLLGGSIGEVIVENDGRANLYGGAFGSDLRAFDKGIITLFGTGLALSDATTGVYFGADGVRYALTGTLRDGTVLDTTAYALGGGRILVNNGVAAAPEPGALALILTGVPLYGLSRRRRK